MKIARPATDRRQVVARHVSVLIGAAWLFTASHPAPGRAVSATLGASTFQQDTADPLRSWNDRATKRAIITFVGRVTQQGGPDFVPVPERIATFDNDGTLWSEKPVPFQVMWTTIARPDGLPSLGVIVHHTDGEFAYDRQRVLSGQLDQGLDEAPRYGWVLADMKQDWNTVFPT